MAYNTKKLLAQAKEMIDKHKLIFIEDVVAFLPCDKTTFYRHFPTESNEYNTLKGLIDDNKVVIKSSLRSKWYKSEAPALQLALYKLSATPEELKQLQMVHTDVTSGGKEIKQNVKFVMEHVHVAAPDTEEEPEPDAGS